MNFSPILPGIIAPRPSNPRSDIQRKLEDDGFRYATEHSRRFTAAAYGSKSSEYGVVGKAPAGRR